MPVPLAPCIHSSGWSNAPTSTSVECGPPPVELTPCAPARPGAFSRSPAHFSRFARAFTHAHTPPLKHPHSLQAPPFPSDIPFVSGTPFALASFLSACSQETAQHERQLAYDHAHAHPQSAARRSRRRRSRTDPTSATPPRRLGRGRPRLSTCQKPDRRPQEAHSPIRPNAHPYAAKNHISLSVSSRTQ